MKKTIIALTLAALPVVAMADVTLFGTIKGGLDFEKTKHVSDTKTNFDDWGSTIGFKGSEKLDDVGNGLKAIWQLKQNVSFAGGKSGWATNESYLGLTSGAGTLRVGNIGDNIKTGIDTFEKKDKSEDDDINVSGGLDDVDPWHGNIGLGLASGIRQAAVRYDTPVMGGFQANLYVSPEDNNGGPIEKGTTVYATGLNYVNSGFFAKYGFELFHRPGDIKDGQVHALEVGYNSNGILVGAVLQYNRYYVFDRDALEKAVNAKTPTADGYGFGFDGEPAKYMQAGATASYTMGNVTPRISYAHGFKKDDKGGYDKVILGADYSLSKRTTAAVAVSWQKLNDGSFVDSVTGSNQQYQAEVGIEHKF